MKVYVITKETEDGCEVQGVITSKELAKRTNEVRDMDWEEFELDALEIPDFAAEKVEFAKKLTLADQRVHEKANKIIEGLKSDEVKFLHYYQGKICH